MSSRPHRSRYLAPASLIALAHSVGAKGKGSSQKINKPTSSGGGGGGSCYDSEGNLITCPLTQTQYIVIGAIAGVVVLVVIASIICCLVRKRRQRYASIKIDTMGVHHKVPLEDPEQATSHDPHKKPLKEMAEDEKLLRSTIYDPHKKPLKEIPEDEKPLRSSIYDPPSTTQDGHQISDSASIASSDYNHSPVTLAQPHDYSYQDPYLTAPPRMYNPPSYHPNTDL